MIGASIGSTKDVRGALVRLETAREEMLAEQSGWQKFLPCATADCAEAALRLAISQQHSHTQTGAAHYMKKNRLDQGAYLARCDRVIAQMQLHRGDRDNAPNSVGRAVNPFQQSLGILHPRTLYAQALRKKIATSDPSRPRSACGRRSRNFGGNHRLRAMFDATSIQLRSAN
jgi:hypothetical protein